MIGASQINEVVGGEVPRGMELLESGYCDTNLMLRHNILTQKSFVPYRFQHQHRATVGCVKFTRGFVRVCYENIVSDLDVFGRSIWTLVQTRGMLLVGSY